MDLLLARFGKGRLRWILPLIFALLVILACGAAPNTVAKAPASTMNLTILIEGQLASDSPATTVAVSAEFSNATEGFVLSGKQSLTCDGVKIPNGAGVPRQSEGAYQFVYTDEQGQQTTLLVPVPTGILAVTYPAEGAAVPIPTNARQTPSVEATPGPRSPEFASSLIIHYRFPLLPPNATATVNAHVNSQNGAVFGPDEPATGTYILSDAGTLYGHGFDEFAPGPGSITLMAQIRWTAPASGFHSAQVIYKGELGFPFTWTAG